MKLPAVFRQGGVEVGAFTCPSFVCVFVYHFSAKGKQVMTSQNYRIVSNTEKCNSSFMCVLFLWCSEWVGFSLSIFSLENLIFKFCLLFWSSFLKWINSSES